MQTPIADFVQAYSKKSGARLHMPGHKGQCFVGCEAQDITEIAGADALYEAAGILAQSEQNAALLFGSGRTLYTTEGASHAIRAMVFLAYQNRMNIHSDIILAARNVHKAFVYACALIDCKIDWLYPAAPAENSICACPITADEVEYALQSCPTLPFAVYLTSPDYLGHQADVAGIAAVCHRFEVPLLVDNAHGAYLHFLPQPCHPLDLGADLCCDSAHKTLPVLTGGAYLQLGQKAAEQMGDMAKSALELTGSTSPSYLILQSLDLCNRYLATQYAARLAACLQELARCRAALQAAGLRLLPTDPLRLVIDAAAAGYTGEQLAERLRAEGGEPEFADRSHLVLMLTPENTAQDYDCIVRALSKLPRRAPLAQPALNPRPLPACCTVRQAIFARQRLVPLAVAEGRICGKPTISCPPAVPIAVSGERLDHEALALFAAYGHSHIWVAELSDY